MPGGEYLNADVLAALWELTDAACRTERADAKQTLAGVLERAAIQPGTSSAACISIWPRTGPMNKLPSASLRTYTTRLSAQSRAQHLPLAEALREYAGAKNKARLPLASKTGAGRGRECAWLKAMVESGELYHPLRWSAAEAFQFLTDVPKPRGRWDCCARAKVRGARAGRLAPKVRATIGGRVPSVLGKDALLDFQVELTLGEERLTAAEIRALLKGPTDCNSCADAGSRVDRDKLKQLLDRFRRIETAAVDGGLPFADAMRLVGRSRG